MSDRKKEEEPEDDAPTAPGWMTTYGDMMTLLMAFFVLIMSFASLEIEKFKAAMGSLQGAFGVLGDNKEVHSDNSWFSSVSVTRKNQSILEKVEMLKDQIAQNNLEEYVEIQATETEILLRIREQILFELGSAELKPTFMPFLAKIIVSLEKMGEEIKVVGHTDNLPIRTAEYPSNWELSIERALNVVQYLVKEQGMDPAKLAAAGHSQYRPLVPNDSPKNRAKNRRVEIFLKL